MKINSIKCEQFAGVLDYNMKFENGLNIIVGQNESGKSTMIDLIYYLLFKEEKLDGRSDVEFMEKYFPKNVNGMQGNIIDGNMCFETKNGVYRIRREWERGEGLSRLTMPDGTIMKGKTDIFDVLKKELQYGEGVFSEIIFPSQKRETHILESMLSERKNSGKEKEYASTSKDIAAVITQAAMETGGVSIEQIEKQLREKIHMYDEDWDDFADLPRDGIKRGIGNKWRSAKTKDAEAGKQAILLKAYYDMKEVEQQKKQAESIEKQVDGIKADIQRHMEERIRTEEKRKCFQDYRILLGKLSAQRSLLIEQRNAWKDMKTAIDDWPICMENIKTAVELRKKEQQVALFEKYTNVQKKKELYDRKKAELDLKIAIDIQDIKKVRELLKKKAQYESRISGLDLVARMKNNKNLPVEITSCVSGTALPMLDGEIIINEAVEIKIADFVQLQIMPRGVRMDEITMDLRKTMEEISTIYEKYHVNQVEELEEQLREYEKTVIEVRTLEEVLHAQLGDMDYDEMKREYKQLPMDLPTSAEIHSKIFSLCGMDTIESFLGGSKHKIKQYEDKYDSFSQLQKDFIVLSEQMKANELELEMMEHIPEEYRYVQDEKQYNEELEQCIRKLDEKIEELREQFHVAQGELGDHSAEEYTEEWMQKQLQFQNKKMVYHRWCHIYEVFVAVKEAMKQNPMKDVEIKFKEYLQRLSEGKIVLDSFDDTMSAKIASKNHRMSYNILSDGTKDTILLAFRLAMLDHLYPEGNGFAIFDDPFTDMDPQRTRRACKLIEEFAKKNQVIFITCDEKYLKMMSGNHTIQIA